MENQFDLIVTGGGMSGVCCAIAAARQGLRVLLVEKGGCLGGTACASGVMHLLGGRRYDAASDRMTREVGGLFDEITDEMIALGKAVDPDAIDVHHYNPYGWYPRMAAGIACDVDYLKYHLERKCLESGVRLLYCAQVNGVETADRRIKALTAHGPGSALHLSAPLYADCTGDAAIAAMSGCSVALGREGDHAVCPSTLIFYVDHVDTGAYVAYQNAHQSPKLVEIIQDLREKGIWRYPFEIFIAIETAEPGVFMVNTPRQTHVDGTDPFSLTQGLIEGRRIAYDLLDIMNRYFPGFENARMRRVFDRMGIRESRRILARHMISLPDALAGRHYESCVASTTYNFDLPDPDRPSYDPMMGDAKNPNANRQHACIEIPYASLLPREMDNLIVAGRCLGAEREVMGACRVMGPCAGMGQAAGNAAALAVQGDFAAVENQALRALLRAQGCIGCR